MISWPDVFPVTCHMRIGMVTRLFLSGGMILSALYCPGQVSSDPGIRWVDSILMIVRTDQVMDAKTKSDLLDSAFHISLRKEDICRQIDSRIMQATHLDVMGQADSALTQLYWVREKYQSSCDSLLFIDLLSNLTNVFLSLNELDRVDSVGKLALTVWNPDWERKTTRFAILTNMAISQAMQGKMDTATATFRQAYYEALAAKDENYIQKELINLGSIKGMTRDLDSAYYFFNMAANNAKAQADMENYMSLLINLADLDRDRGNYKRGIALLDSAYALAEERKSTETRANVQKTRADMYASMSNYEKAYQYLKEFIGIREQYLDEERVKAIADMMEKYESEKKARQIQQLELDKLDATLTNERIRNTRNRFLFIGIGVLVIALGLWSRLRYVHKSRVAIKREKDISEGLLLNILPGSVAQELKEKGFAEAKHFSSVTILFSDFQGFTTISENLSAVELVEEINTCFKSFDNIMTRYGIEKIKTIGDAYMAAGHIPETNTATPADVIMAGLEMQRFIVERKKNRELQQLPAFEMRIGIHSGPVVAGIVGVKKFQYDLWGDTVNTASRMETNGQVGQVNISEATYLLVKDNTSFSFESRGMIEVKGKGKMIMYFVETKVQPSVMRAQVA